MKLRIRYETNYRYAEAVSYSPHFFRLFPKPDTNLRVERFVFETNPSADVQYRRDLFDNIVAKCFYPDSAPELWARLELDLDLEERNAFHFILDASAANLPFAYEPSERRVLEPFLCIAGEPLTLPFWRLEPQPTVSALVGLNNAIHDHLQYERRDEGAARSPGETLALGSGACRDYAVLLAETLRGIGVAARLASGYLRESGEQERRAEGALHAWVEAYLPGAGWVGLDPTNGVFANHCHIATAVGLTPEDVTPVAGIYYASHPVASSMSSALQLSS
jgi:Transglutaminase-like superfamily/Bacterial transglutaminase-like N-terminal region